MNKIIFLITLTFLAVNFAHAASMDVFLSDIDNFHQNDKLQLTENEKTSSASSYAFSKKLFWTPTISGYANSGKNYVNGTHIIDEDSHAWGIRGEWNLFRGGSDYHSMLAADAALTSQNFQQKNQQAQLESKASEIIFRKILLEDTINANQELKRQKEEALRIAQERYRSGRISLQELNRIEVDLSQQLNKFRQTEMDKIDLEQRIKSSYIQKVATREWPLDEISPQKLRLGEKSSESQKLYWTSQSRKYSWRSSYLKHMPSVDWQVNYQNTVPFKLRGADYTWSTTLTLTVPIWNQWQSMSDQAQEYSNYVEAEANFDIAENEEKNKVEALQKKIKILAENVHESKKILKKSEKLYQDTLVGFRYGKVSANDLFMEQNRLIDTRLDYSQNQLSYHMAIVESCITSGKLLRECLK